MRKSTILEAHESLQRKIQACGGANQFVRASVASAATNTSIPPDGVTPNILDKMYNYMHNMANSVTNKKSVLEQLVPTNAKQSYTIVIQDTTILIL